MSYFKYKGYLGTIEPELEDDTLYGKIAHIRDLVTYEAKDLAGLKKEFEFSVDEYLADCEKLGKTPDKPFKGSFNVRIDSELHRKAWLASGGKLNQFVGRAIQNEVERVQGNK